MRTRDYRGDDVIDSRDVIRRIEHLQSEIQDALDTLNATERQALEEQGKLHYVDLEFDLDDTDDLAKLPEALEVPLEIAELVDLLALQGAAEPYAGDWRDGAELVNISYFPRYCKELCEDCGYPPPGLPDWIVIDWDATADNLRVDYTEVEFAGEVYLVRTT